MPNVPIYQITKLAIYRKNYLGLRKNEIQWNLLLSITYEVPKVHPLKLMSFERDLSKIEVKLKHLRSPILLEK